MTDGIIQKPIARNFIFGPLTIFFLVWNIVLFLYSFHFSELLYFSTAQAFITTYFIICSFFIGWFFAKLFLYNRRVPQSHVVTYLFVERLNKKKKIFFYLWLMLTFIEIIYCRGVPVIWLILGNGKTYFDFGIPTVHGFLNSLILSLSLISYYLYVITNRKRHLLIPLFTCCWALVVISRNLLIVNIIQLVILHFYFVKINYVKLSKSLVLLILLILIFGLVGDFRTGKDDFFNLAAVSSSYPTWLPSGFLWVYMYLVTPLNNLINAFDIINPEWSFGLSNSTVLLIPSFLRTFIYGDLSYDSTYYLVTQAFNVSTAYIDPYRDLGYFGVFIFSSVAGFFVTYLSNKTEFKSILFFCILMQCNVLSVFYNHYMYLPIIFQLVVINFCFATGYMRRNGKNATAEK
ncbi:O-antigen ligase [Citrobacter freundii]|uniref:O-antigen polymerase n=1 Tax=Citrobacter freundii TaxID=546 RepID=UPI0024DE7AD9|nr:O-antigen polymerase [Citrobacter freundii]MDK2361013.1 O-antigen ligase [Citrobacter freundii]